MRFHATANQTLRRRLNSTAMWATWILMVAEYHTMPTGATGALGLLQQLRAAGSKSNNSKCFRHEETPPGRTVRAGSCYLLRYVLRLWQFLHRSCRLQSFSWEPCLTIRVIMEKGSSISR